MQQQKADKSNEQEPQAQAPVAPHATASQTPVSVELGVLPSFQPLAEVKLEGLMQQSILSSLLRDNEIKLTPEVRQLMHPLFGEPLLPLTFTIDPVLPIVITQALQDQINALIAVQPIIPQIPFIDLSRALEQRGPVVGTPVSLEDYPVEELGEDPALYFFRTRQGAVWRKFKNDSANLMKNVIRSETSARLAEEEAVEVGDMLSQDIAAMAAMITEKTQRNTDLYAFFGATPQPAPGEQDPDLITFLGSSVAEIITHYDTLDKDSSETIRAFTK